jgi:hypothetical protein
VPATTIEECARLIAARLERCALELGASDLASPATWQQVADRLGVRYHTWYSPGGDRGECAWHPLFGCAIAINEAYPPREQAAAYVHELAHAAVFEWIPPQLTGAADVYRYDDDPGCVRHQVARRVEELVFPSP